MDGRSEQIAAERDTGVSAAVLSRNSVQQKLRGRRRQIALVAGALLLAVVAFEWLRPGVGSRGNFSEGPVPVVAAAVARQDVPVYLDGLGSVTALNSVVLKVRVDGYLNKVNFVEGQQVHAGEVLAEIDPRPYQAALDGAAAKKAQDEAQLANARRDLTRYQALSAKQFVTQQSVDTQTAMVAQLEAAVKGDQANVENAQVQLSYTRITAPLDGRIGLRQIDPGNIVHATDTTGLAVISQIHPISAIFTLPADDMTEISKAMAAGTLAVAAYSHDEKTKLADGQLLTVDNAIDTGTATVKLKAVFPNADNALWPGQFINAHLLLKVEPRVLTILAAAVQRGPQGYYVYLIQPDSSVKMQPVEVADFQGDVAVIGSGLKEGDVVVTNGQSRLQPGVKVTRTSDDAGPAPGPGGAS